MLSMFALMGFLVIVPSAAALASSSDDLQAGLQAVDKKNYQSAIQLITSAIDAGDLPPKILSIAYTWRAVALENNGNETGALSDFDAAVRVNPDDADAHLKRGNAYLQMATGEETEASGAAETGDEEALKEVGKLEANSREHMQRAVADYGEAIRLDSGNYDAYTMRGQAYYFSSRYDEGIADFTAAIVLNPNVADMHAGLGNCLAAQKRYSEAVDEFTRAIALDPNNDMNYIARANAYSDLNKFDEAQSDLATADRLQKRNAR